MPESLVDERHSGAVSARQVVAGRAIYLATFPDGLARLAWAGITHFRLRPTWLRYSAFDTGGEPLIVELAAGFR